MNKLRCYFSFRSPFAMIALYRLRRAPQFAGIDIELLPLWPEVVFGGHMDNPTDNLFKMVYIFGDAARQAELAGLDRTPLDRIAQRFQLPQGVDYRAAKVGIPASEEHWEIPHCAFLYAAAQGKAWPFADLVGLRRFGFDGAPAVDVQDPAIVSELAAQVGLDGAAAAAAWQDPHICRSMDDVVARSEQDGVFGVPFFAIDHAGGTETFWGNDRLEHVLRFLRGEPTLPVIDAASLTDLRN